MATSVCLPIGRSPETDLVDARPRSCIFLELFARRPVFPGQDEIHQLDVIFKLTGTPRIETWPGLHDLPWYELVKPKEVVEPQLRQAFAECVLRDRDRLPRFFPTPPRAQVS